MKLFEQYFNKKHFRRRPHKWFLALCCSPIHAAQVHYQKRYHIRFVHARKLFFFDMVLLATTVVLIGLTAFWFSYDPTVLKDISLSISPVSHELPPDKDGHARIVSGDAVRFLVVYENNSNKVLENAVLDIRLPEGFVLDEQIELKIHIDRIVPKDMFLYEVPGIFFGVPNDAYRAEARLSYMQEGTDLIEEKVSPFIISPRGSRLVSELDAPTQLFARDSAPLLLSLTNGAEHPLHNIHVPLLQEDGVSIVPSEISHGYLESSAWVIDELPSQKQASLSGQLVSTLSPLAEEVRVNLTPEIRANDVHLRQVPTEQFISILHPHVSVSSVWDAGESAVPGSTEVLQVTIANDGDVDLTDVIVRIPLPAALVRARDTANVQGAALDQGTMVLPFATTLAVGEQVSKRIPIALQYWPRGGTDARLQLFPQVSASAADIATPYYLAAQALAPLRIGTSLSVETQARYYTAEGDQLGRGPLPPRVAQETKYWAFITINNASSAVQDLSLRARLPSYVRWTGKTSVTQGAAPVYLSGSRELSWQLYRLGAHQSVGIYVELAFTPTGDAIGTTPPLLTNIQIEGQDTYIDRSIVQTGSSLTTALSQDAIARERGVEVLP